MAREYAGRLLAGFEDRPDALRATAAAHFAGGRAAATSGDVASARDRLEAAIASYDELGMPLEAAPARLSLAEAMRETGRDVAAHEARIALAAFDDAGAGGMANLAASLRASGGPARTGPKALGLLSRREGEVLRLLAEGRSNSEIAARLFISTKTAEHHVSNILAKLHLRSRAEAAASNFAIPSRRRS